MSSHPPIDLLNQLLIEYVYQPIRFSTIAYETARWAILDSTACALFALRVPECVRLLGDWHALGAEKPQIAQDPIKAVFDISLAIRWLDFNDTWLGQEWGHPSDNLGAIFSAIRSAPKTVSVRTGLNAMIKAYEIQGQLARVNNFHQHGLDHVLLVKLASCAVSSWLLGLSPEHAEIALSHVWMDGPSLRVYRHGDNTISRKSWAAGDASARGFQLAWMVGRAGIPGAMGARTDLKWGFEKWFCQSTPVVFPLELGSHVIENILFKVQYPIEFHAQTAVECAEKLYGFCQLKGLSAIKTIHIETHHAALEIICKTGLLKNPADRDHCLQYCVALFLVMGTIEFDFFSDYWIFTNPDLFEKIETLRKKIQVTENLNFTNHYPERGISNAMQIIFESGEFSERVQVDYPLGHVSRRQAAKAELIKKYHRAVSHKSELLALWDLNLETVWDQSVDHFLKLLQQD